MIVKTLPHHCSFSFTSLQIAISQLIESVSDFVCDTYSFTSFKAILGAETLIMENLSGRRPDAHGTINRELYPNTGQVTFPDDRTYIFFFYPDEGAFYWDGDKGDTDNAWLGGVPSDCSLVLEDRGKLIWSCLNKL